MVSLPEMLEQLQCSTLMIPLEFIPVCGSLPAAILLAFLVSECQRCGCEEITLTQQEITNGTSLGRPEQETARRNLRHSGVLIEHRRGLPARLFYQLDWDVLIDRLKKGATLNRPGVVYLVSGTSGFKIGFSRSFKERLQGLRLEYGDVQLIHTIETTTPEADEAAWHERFAAQRLHGEWFALTEADVAEFCA